MLLQQRRIFLREAFSPLKGHSQSGRKIEKEKTFKFYIYWLLFLHLFAVLLWRRSQTGNRFHHSSSLQDRVSSDRNLFPDYKTMNFRKGENSRKLFTDEEAKINSHLIQLWRTKYIVACRKGITQVYHEKVIGSIFSSFHDEVWNQTQLSSASSTVKPCHQTFLDLESVDVLDTVGKIVDSGLPVCGDQKMGLHYDLDHGTLQDCYRDNIRAEASKWFFDTLEHWTSIQPENVCVFSVNGNSAFSERLKKIEYRIMSSIPRPIRQIHFFTDSILVTAIDTLSDDDFGADQENGSKLIHRASSTAKRPTAANITSSDWKDQGENATFGYTLEQIINLTTVPSQQSRLLLKLSLSERKCAILNQATDVLCNLVQKLQTSVGLMILGSVNQESETNSEEETMKYLSETESKLQLCGVQIFRKKL